MYPTGVGADGMAAKGALHVCVELPSESDSGSSSSIRENKDTHDGAQYVHLFCTHLQATYVKEDWDAAKVQGAQLTALRDFVDEQTANHRNDQVQCGSNNVGQNTCFCSFLFRIF